MLLSLALSIFAIAASTVSAVPFPAEVNTPPALFSNFQTSNKCTQDCIANATCENGPQTGCACTNMKIDMCSHQCGTEPAAKIACPENRSALAAPAVPSGGAATPAPPPKDSDKWTCYKKCIDGKGGLLTDPTPCATSTGRVKKCSSECKIQYLPTETCPPAEKDVASAIPYSGSGKKCFNDCVSRFVCPPRELHKCVSSRSYTMLCSLRCGSPLTPSTCPGDL